MADDIAKLRAALNNSWEDNSHIPDLTPYKTDPFSLVKQAYQYMPGAGIGQAAVSMGSDAMVLESKSLLGN